MKRALKNLSQTIELKKKQKFQEIEEDREIQQRKVLEDSDHENSQITKIILRISIGLRLKN